MQQPSQRPNCLVFAGHDPSGGAGLQADIEAINSMGANALTIPTALTTQNTSAVFAVDPVDPQTLIGQAQRLLDDVEIHAIKLGLLPAIPIVEAVAQIINTLEGIPVVLDPIIRSGSGQNLQENQTSQAVKALLFSRVTVLTPNSEEARYFCDAEAIEACALQLLAFGCENVLVTGGHEHGDEVVNQLYGDNRHLETYRWPRVSGEFHGTGCTLASAIAGLLAKGTEPGQAVQEAQAYVHDAIASAKRVGNGQLIPDRFYWAKQETE